MSPAPAFKALDHAKVRNGVRLILEGLGEDVTREGLLKTPERVMRSYEELLSGRELDPAKILATDFDREGYDELVTLREIDFYSLCEHHMIPFYGTVTVAYIPRKKVVGLSKLARLVDLYARRLQIQERMTRQIGEALAAHLKPRGWAVAVKGVHLCMCARGVKKHHAEMVTSAVGGLIKSNAKARAEFLRLAGV